jgi:hypothetical protein
MEEIMKCPKCGYDNKDGADHCDLCKDILAKPPESSRPRPNMYQSREEMSAPPRPAQPVNAAATGDGKIDHMEAIKFGWEAMKENIWLFIGIGAAAVGIYGIEWVVEMILKGGGRGNFVSFIMQLAFGYLNAVVFTLGYNKVCLKMVDGEQTEFGDLFSCFHLGWNFILACIIMGLLFIPVGLLFVLFAVMLKKAVFLGIMGMLIIICVLSIVIMRFIFISYIAIDKELGPMDIVKTSWNMTKGRIWDMSIFFLWITLVIIAGALCLGVGLIAAAPTTAVATAYYYRQLSKQL